MAKLNNTTNYYKVELKDHFTITELEQLTVKQLRTVVWNRTKEVNDRYNTMDSIQSKSMYQMLMGVSGQKLTKHVRGKEVSVNKLSANVGTKSKKELIYQVQRLQEFISYDQESEIYNTDFNEKLETQFQSFLDNKKHSDLRKIYDNDPATARQIYIDWVNAAGAIGGDLEQVDSDTIVSALIQSYKKGKRINVVSLLKDAKSGLTESGQELNSNTWTKEFARRAK